MYRRALQTLFVAATLLLTTTACDQGGDTKGAAKDAGKKTDDGAKVDAGKTDAEPVKEEPVKEEPVKEEPVKEEPSAEEGGEVAAADDTDAAADAGEKDGGDADVKDPPNDPPKNPPKDEEKGPPKDGGDVTAKVDAKALFDGKCKSCHGADGKGDTTIGKKVNIPSLSGTSLSKSKVVSIIESGVPDTKMKGYKDKLSKDEIDALAGYVKKL